MPAWPAQYDEIAELAAAGDADLRHDDAMATRSVVVPNLDQIINLRTFADHGVADRAAVDGGAGADLYIVLDNDAAELRNFLVAPGPDAKPKPGCPICAPASTVTPSPRCAKPIPTWLPISQFRPIVTPRPITALGPTTSPAPISTPGPITTPGASRTVSSSFALGWIGRS